MLITIGRRRARWARATAVFRLTQFGRLHRSVWRLKNAWNQTRALLYFASDNHTPSIHTTRSFSVQCYRLCLQDYNNLLLRGDLVVCIRSIWCLGCCVLCAAFHHLGISATAICGAFSELVLVAPNRNICFYVAPLSITPHIIDVTGRRIWIHQTSHSFNKHTSVRCGPTIESNHDVTRATKNMTAGSATSEAGRARRPSPPTCSK